MSDLPPKHHWEIHTPHDMTTHYCGFSEAGALRAIGKILLEHPQQLWIYRDHKMYRDIAVVDVYALRQKSGWIDEQTALDIQEYEPVMNPPRLLREG